jgi:hypothetical protein
MTTCKAKLAKADMYIRWALPTFHSTRKIKILLYTPHLLYTRASVQHKPPLRPPKEQVSAGAEGRGQGTCATHSSYPVMQGNSNVVTEISPSPRAG